MRLLGVSMLLVVWLLLVGVLNADPRPHSDQSKLFLLSKLAFNFVDTNGDGRLNEAEFVALRDLPVNGLVPHSAADVEKLRDAMDVNDDSLITEDEFVRFDRWLPALVNGRRASNVPLAGLARFRESGAASVAYSHLDTNGDGVLDQRELASNGF